MNIICTDVETTGLDPKTAACIEVACVVYDLEARCVTETFSSLIHATENAAEDINRIPVNALVAAPPASVVWGRVRDLVGTAQANGGAVYMAHRAEFDRSFFVPSIAELAPWVCSKFDVEWPESKPGDHLVNVALAHGVAVQDNHRALTDALLIAKTLQRVHASRNVMSMVARAMLPRALFQAVVSYDDREKAKAAGFAWDGATKRWTKRLVVDERHEFAFPVRQVSA